MTTGALGRIEEVEVREIWPSEPQDFTPWLAENLDELGAALHLDMQLVESEGAVGSFAVDIIAEAGNGLVVIENQLEQTDHSHLGQLLTYAAGRDARSLIWITPTFRDEHRAALDWLNRWTSEEIEVYGVEDRAVRIGASLPAPLFHPVAFPNSWSRQASSRSVDASMSSDEKIRRIAFFDKLVNDAHGRGLTNSRTAGSVAKSKSFPCRVGERRLRGLTYWVDLRSNGAVVVKLDIRTEDLNRNAAIVEALVQDKRELERELSFQPEWLAPDPTGPHGRQSAVVMVRRDISITDPPERLEEVRGWILDKLEGFQRVLAPRLGEILEDLDSEEA